MRKIKHWHDLAVEAEAELAKLLDAPSSLQADANEMSAAPAVLADHPAPLGNSVLQLAPYWQVRAKRAQDATSNLLKPGGR